MQHQDQSIIKLLRAILPVALLLPTARVIASDWPQWRGPTRDAKVASGPAWPDSLRDLNRQWHVTLGPGYSGPIVCGSRVFVAETQDKTTEVVRALDRESGKELWRAAWPGSMSVPFFAKSNGDWIRSTPACDGESLFVAGMRDVLVCLEAATGAKRWRVDFPDRPGAKLPSFGCVSSPLVVGQFVYLQAGGGFAKVDKATGEVAWHILRDGGGMNSAFSSPIHVALDGVPQILVQTREELVGVDPDKGAVLWRVKVPAYRGMNILTPTVFGSGVLTSTYKNRSFFFGLRNSADGFDVEERWNLPAKGYMSSPVVIGWDAYMHLANGRLCCIDLINGVERWRSKPYGKYWSMAARGNRILALDERGSLLLIDASPEEFRLLDNRRVSENECWAHIAVAGADVVVRDLGGVSLFQWGDQATNR